MKFVYHALIGLFALLVAGCATGGVDQPNILWITSEDNSCFLGCYGDTFATTPNLDKLAEEGFLYTHAYANTPVCAPARNTIITGVLACSSGNEQMRSTYPKSDQVKFFTQYLLEKGYYCTNNSKTDYNLSPVDLSTIWDESSNKAHYRNRGEGQPFFAVFNLFVSHESSIHTSIPDSLLRHKPEDVVLPPYHPDTKEFRHDWAQYYDKVEDMDRQVGALLSELDSLGLSDNTIVFYYSDHGGILGRSKRFLYETGTHVPMIIRIPKKFRKLYPGAAPGAKVDRLVSFVDLAPTMLSLTGTKPPEYMQGSAFLGAFTGPEPDLVYMFRDRMDERYDLSRSITDGQFRYTRNFNPGRIYMQYLEYLWRAPSMRSWEKAYKEGKCNEVQAKWWEPKPLEELYDINADPWEIKNLAGDPAYSERLNTMRRRFVEKALSILDAGFIPEADRIDRAGDMPVYDLMRSGNVPLEEILDNALSDTEIGVQARGTGGQDGEGGGAVSGQDKGALNLLLERMDHKDPAIRYWASQGLLLLGEKARPGLSRIRESATDPSWCVSVTCAEILYRLGEKDAAIGAYERVLKNGNEMARTLAVGSIDEVGGTSQEFLSSCLDVLNGYETLDRQFDVRAIKDLLLKWKVDTDDLGLVFNW